MKQRQKEIKMIVFCFQQVTHLRVPPMKQLCQCPPHSPAPLCHPCCPSGQAPRSRPVRYKGAQLVHLMTTSIPQHSNHSPVGLDPHPKDTNSHRNTSEYSEKVRDLAPPGNQTLLMSYNFPWLHRDARSIICRRCQQQ